jgi:predicted transcriptional regulator
MPDRSKKFHEFALKSILFKGRTDWYYCYLKLEKIAHVLLLLSQKAPLSSPELARLVESCVQLPETMAHFAAGEVDLSVILADIFGALSLLRFASTRGSLSKENSLIIMQEYETLAEKMAGGGRVSPFLTSEDFSIPTLPEDPMPLLSGRLQEQNQGQIVKDIGKGQNKGHTTEYTNSVENKRMSLILEFVRKHKSISIKDVSAVITDCSEKTIQRDLHTLIKRGLVRKEGDRRWSQYLPI